MIKLSPAFGLNPSCSLCYYCNQHKNELILAGKLRNDVEAPRQAIWNLEPCDECKKFMEQRVILISIKNGESELMEKKEIAYNNQNSWRPNSPPFIPNPFRSGCFCVVSTAFIERVVISKQLCDFILHKRFCFIEDKAWDLLGLPRENIDNRSKNVNSQTGS